MFYSKSKTLMDKNIHLVLSVIFAVFIFTQFVSLHHQVHHFNEYNDIACVQCISLPDQLGDSSTILFIVHQQERTVYKSTHKTKSATLTLKAYSARAPPSIT